MKAEVVWRDAMVLEGKADGHQILLDAKAPIGKNSAMTPKELLLVAMGGCTAMDILALLNKWKLKPHTFGISVEVETSTGVQPAVFTGATLTYECTGDIEDSKLIEAVRLSQTKYCGVSAMLNTAFPIHYKIFLNNREVGGGQADFNAKTKGVTNENQ